MTFTGSCSCPGLWANCSMGMHNSKDTLYNAALTSTINEMLADAEPVKKHMARTAETVTKAEPTKTIPTPAPKKPTPKPRPTPKKGSAYQREGSTTKGPAEKGVAIHC